MISHVNYRTGRASDMAAVTRAAAARGNPADLDLAHSAGALPIGLNAHGVEFAVGCTYKYLNGGPGSPAFVFVREDRQGQAVQPISGWFGHANPFALRWRLSPLARHPPIPDRHPFRPVLWRARG